MSAAFDWTILMPAILAGMIVSSTHVPFGREVLRRGIIFIDLAVAQIAALGVIAAHLFDHEPGSVVVQIAAFVAALLGALVLYGLEKRFAEIQEALIGTAFVLAASAGILLLAANPHGGEHLRELLAGQILWAQSGQLIAAAIINAVILVLWYFFRARSGAFLFYILFAAMVTVSVQLVGVYLVFASLILPALASHRYAANRQVPVGYVTAAAGYLMGIPVSAAFDLPTGTVIVFTLAVVALAAGMLAPRRGTAPGITSRS